MTKSNQSKYLSSYISKMENAKLHQVVIDTFSHYYKKVVSGATGLISDRDIRPVVSDEIEDAKETLRDYLWKKSQVTEETSDISISPSG